MSDITEAAAIRPTVARGGAFYRLVWKWHFLASLYVLPFMAMLSITGGLYLYKPQIENWLYAERLYVEAQESALPIAVQIAQLDTFVGISRMRAVVPSASPGQITHIDFNTPQCDRSYAWINPYTAEIIAVQTRDTMLMHQVKKFHGELLLGDIGIKFVELAAHWAVIMLVTGAVLWLPRGTQRLLDRAALPSLPKNQATKRGFWKQMHLFTAMLAVVLVLPISWPVATLILTLMILLPLVGASLIVALALDWIVFRKLGWFRGASAPQAAE